MKLHPEAVAALTKLLAKFEPRLNKLDDMATQAELTGADEFVQTMEARAMELSNAIDYIYHVLEQQ